METSVPSLNQYMEDSKTKRIIYKYVELRKIENANIS